MNRAMIFCLGSLICAGTLHAEPRTFTNKDGKTLTAELVAVENENVVLKLGNAKIAKVPLSSLSDSDQEFINSWWEKNKNKVTEMDVRLVIDKNSKRVPQKDDGAAKGKGPKKKVTVDEVQYVCVLKSYTKKDLSNITANYTVYKRISSRGEDGSSTTTEEIDGTATVASLLSQQSATFETAVVSCEDSSQKGGKGPSTSKRETVIGMVVTLSADGEEFMKQSFPDNFLDRLKEEEEREAAKNDD